METRAFANVAADAVPIFAAVAENDVPVACAVSVAAPRALEMLEARLQGCARQARRRGPPGSRLPLP